MRALITLFRAPLVPFLLWLGVLQSPIAQVRTLEPHMPESFPGLLSIAATLAGLTVAVYRLGVWREQMNNAKDNVTAEVARHREEANQHFAAIEWRLASIERYVATGAEQRVALERWQGRVDVAIESQGRRIDAMSTVASKGEMAA